ncbi:helix-turn-helix transcriptional regulator [Streptomyces sp. NPDC001941]|uniref:helix-turn-helix domain-containing protein n=1 Tax=Streptomyces sp. NPDC001941 TaxID=3154659 RepID=UPI0033177FC5
MDEETEEETGVRVCPYCLHPFVAPATLGRPRVYCSPSCRQGAHRRRQSAPERPPAPDEELLDLALDMQEEVRRFVRLFSSPDAVGTAPLTSASRVRRALDALTAASVHRARDGRIPWDAIGSALGISPERARKTYAPGVREPRPVPPPRGAPPEAAVADADSLASALSALRDASRLSQGELARRMSVSPSHVSRMLSGRRVPRWHLVEDFVLACGGDPRPFRALWARQTRGRDAG